MALSAPSNLTGVTSTANTDNIATGSISPSSNSLLIVSVGNTNNSITTISSISTTLSNVGSWTIVQDTVDIGGGKDLSSGVAYALVTGAPGSGTITTTFSVATRHKIMRVAEVTGHDTSTPVVQNKTNTGTSTGLTVTLDSTPDAANMVFATVKDVGLGTITAGSGFTEIGETVLDSSQDSTIQTQYDYQSADTTADWTTLGGTGNVGAAIEIAEAGGAEAAQPIWPILTTSNKFRGPRFA